MAAGLAHAGTEPDDPNDPNTPSPLGPNRPCLAVADVVATIAFGFEDANDPNSTNWYTALADCANVCKKTGTVCQKYVKKAASCEAHAIDNHEKFNVKKHCDGLRGDALKTCSQPFVDQQTADHATTAADVTTANDGCNAGAALCAGTCSAPQ
jgi:hypothetical protein